MSGKENKITSQKVEAIKTDLAVIRKEYKFKGDYDLYEKLLHIPINLASFESAASRSPREAETKKELISIELMARKLHELLTKDTTLQTKILLTNILLLDESGEFSQNGSGENYNWNFREFERVLDALIASASFAQKYVHKDRGGRKPIFRVETVIYLLAFYFHKGTGKTPRCSYSQVNDRYRGEFYEFILDIEGCLNDVGVELPNRETIGKHARVVSSKYRKQIGKQQQPS